MLGNAGTTNAGANEAEELLSGQSAEQVEGNVN